MPRGKANPAKALIENIRTAISDYVIEQVLDGAISIHADSIIPSTGQTIANSVNVIQVLSGLNIDKSPAKWDNVPETDGTE